MVITHGTVSSSFQLSFFRFRLALRAKNLGSKLAIIPISNSKSATLLIITDALLLISENDISVRLRFSFTRCVNAFVHGI